ncbi:TetR/AcrR family transcriptional regulator [Actomonas aquatica]|uniref:TetR/AcrR family transcriptional regulator n=1 Tax=Actomonas aquatica TaxID=2866162 RepID=A0ABZ1C8U1_9BACT|nr:TetR/AcrR family transcriptional regulator [Opitutus sp. WL0086]WRQ87827.1 TetR/AcrR family transcriptional regulator [Opitutus sp. WL0086]
MDAALSLMWEESYGAVSVDDICRKADVRKGSFYYYFSSKSELAVRALDRMWEEHKRALEEYFAASRGPIERIRARCDQALIFQREMKQQYGRVLGCPLCSLGSEICNQDSAIRDKVREILDLKVGYWEQAIREAQDLGLLVANNPTQKARCAMAFFEGMIAQARLHDDLSRLEGLADQMCEHLGVRSSVTA